MIVGKPIVVFLNEAEADVIQAALSVWRGPYGKDRTELAQVDQPNHDRKTQLAEQMCESIRNELQRLYDIDQASRLRQGVDQHGHVDLFNEYQLGDMR